MKHAKWWVVVGVAGVWWWRGGGEPSTAPTVQAAVLSKGFAAVVSPPTSDARRRVVELDRTGKTTHEMPLQLDGEVRLVGTSAGTAVGWKDGKKIKLGILDSEGKPEDPSSWGKRAQRLCDGVASNEHRFGVGWLEGDGGIWFVGGPVRRMFDEPIDAAGIETATKVTWCGIASADDEVVLLWRDGKKLLMNFCAKQCSPQVSKVPIDPDHQLLGFGCARASCLFAARDKAGAVKLYRANENGRTISRPLDGVRGDTMPIIGAGPGAFAIAYPTKDNEVTIQRITVDLETTHDWHFDAGGVPGLAWAGDRLLVAQPGAFHVLDVPRVTADP